MARQFRPQTEQTIEPHQKNGFARVVGLRTIDEEGVFTVEVEVFVDEVERNKIIDILNKYDILNELPTVGNKVFDTFSQLREAALDLDSYEGEVLRNHMRQHPPKGGGFPEAEEAGAAKLKRVPVARELVKSRIPANEWADFVKEWRERGFSRVKSEDGQLHDVYNPECQLCRKKFVGYRPSTRTRKLKDIAAGKDPYGGFCCGDPVRPVELMHGFTLGTRSGLLSRDTQYSYESPTYVNFSLPELANVIIRLYIPEIKEAVKKRFGFEKLDNLAFGKDDENITIPDPERTDPRYLNRIVSLQHMKYAFPTNVAYKIPENQPQWFIYNTEAYVNFGREPLEQNPWDPNTYDPIEEKGAPPEGILDRLKKIIQAARLNDFVVSGTQPPTRICDKCKSIGLDAACSKCGSSTHPNVRLDSESVSISGDKENVYVLETGIEELNKLVDAFVPPIDAPTLSGPVCWGVAGRSDVQVVDLLQEMINNQIEGAHEIYLHPLTATYGPVDDEGNIYFMTAPPAQDLKDLGGISGSLEIDKLKKPTNLAQRYQTESLIKKTISYFPTEEELKDLKERFGVFVDKAGKYGPKKAKYEFDDLLLWIDPKDIQALETPPPFFDTQNRYVRRKTFETIRELYQKFSTERDPKKRHAIKNEIADLKKSDNNQVYIWDWIVNPMDPNHPVLVPDKECVFKSILDDPQFQLWLSDRPDKGGAGCIWDEDSLDWKRVYYKPDGTYIRFNDPEFWKSSLPDLIQQDAKERTQEIKDREIVVTNEILKLIAPTLQEMKRLDPWYQKQFDNLIPLEIRQIKNRKTRDQEVRNVVADLNERLRSLAKDADPELDEEERQKKITQYQQILSKLRNTKISIQERAKHIFKDAGSWRVSQLESPTRLTPPDENGLDQIAKITGEKSVEIFSPDWWQTLYEQVNNEGQEILFQMANQYLKYDELQAENERLKKETGKTPIDLAKKIQSAKNNLPGVNDVKKVIKQHKLATDTNDLPSWFFLKNPKTSARSRKFDVKITKFFEKIMQEDDLIAKLRAERRPYSHEENAKKLKSITDKTKKPIDPEIQVDPTDTKTTSDLKPLGGDPTEPMPGEPNFDAADYEDAEDWDISEFFDEDAEEEDTIQQNLQSQKELLQHPEEEEPPKRGQIGPMIPDDYDDYDGDDDTDEWG